MDPDILQISLQKQSNKLAKVAGACDLLSSILVLPLSFFVFVVQLIADFIS